MFLKMEFYWNAEKNELLKGQRDVSFEMVREEIVAGRLLAEIPNPRRPSQRIFIVLLNGYVCAVPFIKDGNSVFLKTIYQDRTLNKLHGVNRGKAK
jgi:hypothetical protein